MHLLSFLFWDLFTLRIINLNCSVFNSAYIKQSYSSNSIKVIYFFFFALILNNDLCIVCQYGKS